MTTFKQIYLTLRDPTIEGQNGPGNNGNRVIAHSSEIQNWSLTTCCTLVSYPGHPFSEGPDPLPGNVNR